MLDLRTRLTAIAGLLALAAAPAAALEPGAAYDPTRQVIVLGGIWLHHLRPAASPSEIYETPVAGQESSTALWEGAWPLSDLRLSPTGGRIAFREHTYVADLGEAAANFTWHSVDGSGNPVTHHDLDKDVLRVIAPDGSELASVDFVYRYSWSPDGTRIALLRGDPYEGGVGFTNPSIWVLELASGELEKVFDRGLDLAWAKFDGNLYIQEVGADDRAYRYLPEAGKIEITAHRGVHFSPDGAYYYRPSYEGTPFRLFERETNEEITAGSAILERFPAGLLQPRGWLDDRRLVAPSPTPGKTRDYLYDPGFDRGWEIAGRVLALLGDGTEALVLRADGIGIEKIEAP